MKFMRLLVITPLLAVIFLLSRNALAHSASFKDEHGDFNKWCFVSLFTLDLGQLNFGDKANVMDDNQ